MMDRSTHASWIPTLLLAGLLAIPAQAETVTYLHTDLLGSVVLETDQNRNVVARYEYEPYGLPRQAIADAPGYTGHVHDAGSGLVYMQQRYYDPEVGRFLSVDPVGVDLATGANFNRYWYGNNNPHNYTDPDGQFAIPLPLIPPAVAAAAKATMFLGTAVAAAWAGSEAINAYNESAEAQPSGSNAPEVPGELVGENPTARGSGNSVTSGPLAPENGGTGDYDADLGTLAGETTPAGPGDKAPPGAQIGENGVFGRPENSSGGRSIDIPSRGDKPHETLH